METRPLDTDERENLSTQRAWINALLADTAAAATSAPLRGTREDIPTLHSLLAHGPYTEDAEAELQLFGTAFGDVVASELDMAWVVVTDEFGTDFALQPAGASTPFFIFPQDMLIKRVENGEPVDEIDLDVRLAGLASELQQFTADNGAGQPG
jgi:hypothetical protein